jgi:7-cyano-7-deazaguanine reductase
MSAELTMLGQNVDPLRYGQLEVFPVERPVRVTFRSEELEALCPAVDGIQPDIYKTEISYTAETHALESKSLKLWLVTFRNERIFGEHLAIQIHERLIELEPAIKNVRVSLLQNARGGITTEIVVPS